MNESRLIEVAVTVRMTLSRPDIFEKRGARAVFVAVADHAEARRLSGVAGLVEEKVGVLEGRPVVRIAAKTVGAEMAKILLEVAREKGKIPCVVCVEKEALLAVGTNRGETVEILSRVLDARPRSRGVKRTRKERLAGHVAVVTGAAQGFGEGIAEGLAAEGACVVIADINDERGQSVSTKLNKKYGEGTALYHHTDVTDAESTHRCVLSAVRSFGGIDLFIANAGVLKAGGVNEMDEETFDFVTNVNYKAFFLGVKAVVPIMQAQHACNPHHFMDIIQINSKSGLQGSHRNFAYAGSKFGSIGLVQSFAMELIPWRIKVNAICPGNYFDGPLWSDPERGLFVQYLRAGKVPGARSVEDVRHFYLSKVPMGRGCLPSDVVKAILYLHDQEYETGQALPVTGGQVMLK